MSDKPQMKRGILSSLMGLFGEEGEESESAGGNEAPGSAVSADQAQPQGASEVSGNGNGAGELEDREDEVAGPIAGPAVVRESYEPGWYAVSAARWHQPSPPPAPPAYQEPPPSVHSETPRWEMSPEEAAPVDAPMSEPQGQASDAAEAAAAAFTMTPEEVAEAPFDEAPFSEPEAEQAEEPSVEASAVPFEAPEDTSWQEPVAESAAEEAVFGASSVETFEPAPFETGEGPPVAERAEAEAEAGPEPEPEWTEQAEAVVPEPEWAEPEVSEAEAVEAEAVAEIAEAEAVEAEREVFVPAEAAFDQVAAEEVAAETDAMPEEPEWGEDGASMEAAVDESMSADTVEVPMPLPDPDVAALPVAPASVAEPPGLASRVAAERRRALEEMMARGIADVDVAAVSRMLQDPERRIRLLALEALGSRPDAAPSDSISQALRDPSDEVRAGAVRLAASRQSHAVPEVFPLVAERQWPAAQQAVLEVLPRSIALNGIADDDLDSMLGSVARMESHPNAVERSGFAALAGAVGRDRLVATMESIGQRRLGAARLLLEEGSTETLRALSTYGNDPDPEVARLGRAAADLLGTEAEEHVVLQEEPEEQDGEPVEDEMSSFEAALGPQGQMISGLARALGDPDEAVRVRAAEALRAMDRATLLDWIATATSSGDPEQVAQGAHVAGAAGLSESAPDLLMRGVASAPEARGPFVRALASFGMAPEALVDLARGGEGQNRPEAIRMLWHVAGRSLLPALHPLLEDSSAAVRVAALEVFGESGDTQTIEVAQRVLERDSSPVVRATAISVIGRAGLDQRVTSLAQAMSDPDPDVRATAVEVLPAGMGRQAADLLLEALTDQDERVWQAAIRHLASVPDRDRSIVWTAIERCPATRREHLVSTLERSSAERLALLALDHLSSPDAAERTLAIALAGRAGTPECLRGIITALQDPAPTVRRTAASALLTLRNAESIPGLARALSDPDVEVRVEAVRALSVIDDDNVLDPLITALKDPEMRVRDVAGEALVRWRSPAVARRLAVALTNPSLRRPAGEVLARMGTSAVDPLVDILMEDDPELAGTVGQLLESLVGPELFLTRLGSMDPHERLRAVEALGAIRGNRGVDGLIRALTDPVESIRIRAVTLLGEIGDDRAFEAVKRTFLGDPVLEVVSASEEALRRLQTGDRPDRAR